jgi:hypothetical protein
VSANNYTLERTGRSLIWSRDTGNRVIVVIDDDFLQVLNPKPNTAHAVGLRPVFEYMSQLPDTRAVGYFFLPDTDELMERRLCPDIQNWLDELAGTQRLYFLIDVFYGQDVSDERSAFGVTVLNYLRTRFPGAKFAYFNTAGAPEGAQDANFPVRSILKSQVAEAFRLEPPTLPKIMLEFFDVDRPSTTASNIDVPTWKRLRAAAAKMCRLIDSESGLHAADDVGGWMWAHHLPHGGEWWGALVPEERQKLWTEQVREACYSVAPAADGFPDYAWEIESDNGVFGWERPPIRALAQFDEYGRDLSAAFYLLKNEVGSVIQNDVTILFASTLSENPECLSRDYLWFNVSALARGLFMLAQSFRGEVNKARNDSERGRMGLKLPCIGGRLFWHINEIDDAEQKGLQLRIHQYLLGWNKNKDKDQPCFQRLAYPFRSEDEAVGQVKKAYDYFRRSGAKIDVQDKTLLLTLRAAEVRDEVNPNVVYWEVFEQ